MTLGVLISAVGSAVESMRSSTNQNKAATYRHVLVCIDIIFYKANSTEIRKAD